VKTVTGAELRAKLGNAAWLVWQRGLKLRGPDNRYWATVETMARPRGQQELSDRTTKRALSILRQAGLVHQPMGVAAGKPDGPDGADGLGFQTVETPRGPRRLFVRRVFGRLSASKTLARGQHFEVPDATWAWLLAVGTHGHGGRRTGAGRPKKRAPEAPENNQEAPTLGAACFIQAAPTSDIQAAPLGEILRREILTSSDLLASLEDARRSDFADRAGSRMASSEIAA
jgi:hypothetical protein